MPTAISAEGLCRHFGDEVALAGLDLEIPAGEVLAMLGPNGAGKTTTVRLLNGVLRPTSGRAQVLGLDPTNDGDELRTRTGVLTEHAGLDDRLTARENLRASARIRRLGAAAEDRIDALLARFGMSDRADKLVAGSSTGQRKRIALVRELLHDPELLFLDEPTSGLDPGATRDVIGIIGTLAAEHGRTIVLATHFLGEAGRLADRVAILDRGTLLASGTIDGLAAEYLGGAHTEIRLDGAATGILLDDVRRVGGVSEVAGDGSTLSVWAPESAIPDVVSAAVGSGARIAEVTRVSPTLEDVYFAVLDRHGAVPELAPVADAPWPMAVGR